MRSIVGWWLYMLACAAVVAMFAPQARAETWMTLGFTDHSKDKRYCEVHPGVLREWRYTDVRFFLGAHQNSHCEASAVGGVAYLPLRYGRYSAGLVGMGLTGYERPVIPAGALAIAYDTKTHGVDLAVIPGILVHLRWRWAF